MHHYISARTTSHSVAILLVLTHAAQQASAQLITYSYSGTITEIFQNENEAIPNLAIGDPFSGIVTFESSGWHRTSGTVSTTLNGINLLFTGQYIYGDVEVIPSSNYSIRIAGDTGGSITGSTFSAGNFGPDLEDTDGSAGYTEPFPASLNLQEFEENIFRISGSFVSNRDRISATGRLTNFFMVPEPTSLWIGVCVFLTLPCYIRSYKVR